MAQTSNDPASDHDGAVYPNPPYWEYMTHEEQYGTLRSEPKPDTAVLRNALLRAKQDVLRDQNDERRAFQEARQMKNPSRRTLFHPLSVRSINSLTLQAKLFDHGDSDLHIRSHFHRFHHSGPSLCPLPPFLLSSLRVGPQ